MAETDSVTVVAKIHPKPGKEDDVAGLLVQMAQAVMRHEPECIVYRPHRLAGDGGSVFLFYEQYRSRAAFDFHRTAPHLVELRGRLKDLLARPTEVEMYSALTDQERPPAVPPPP
jgi:quinol monooxygenase YgiN